MKRAGIPASERDIRFTIPRVPLSRNKLDKMHWAQRHREAMNWKDEVFVALRWKVSPAPIQKHVSIRVVWGKGQRRLDDDNLRGGCKPVLDALKSSGVIYDDSPRWITSEYAQELASKAGGLPRTEITVEAR